MSDDADAEFADRVLRIGPNRPRLKPDGKPMRALRVLAGEPDRSFGEWEVHHLAWRRTDRNREFYGALSRLVACGYAARRDRQLHETLADH